MSPQSASPSGRRPPPPAAFFAGPPSAAGAGGGAARTPARSPAEAVSPSPASAPPALPGLRHPALLGGKAHQHPAGGFPFAGPRDSGFRLPPDESTPAAQANARPQARSAGPAARAAAANAPPPAGFPMNIAFGVPSGTPAEMAEAMLSTHFSEMFAASQRSDASRSPPGDRRHRRHHSFLPRRRLAISSPTLVASSTARKDTIPIVRPADDAGEVVRRGRRNSLPQSELGLVKRLLRQAISMSPKLKAFGGPASAPEDDSGSSTSGSRCSSAGRGPDILYPREETRPSSRQRTGEAGAAPRRTSPPSHPEVPDGPPGFPHEIPVAGPASSAPKSLPTAGPSPPDTASSKESPAAGFVSLTEADHKWITPERDKEAVEADDADVDRLSRMMRAAACREKTFIREITSAPAPAQHPGAFRGPQPEAAAPLPVGLGLSFAKGCHMPSKSGSEETFRAGACLASPGEKARGGPPGVGSPFEPASVGSRSFSPPYPGATSPPPTPDSAGEAEGVAALFGRAPPPAEGAESAARPSPPGPVSEPSANAPPPPASAGRPTHHEDNGADDGDRTKVKKKKGGGQCRGAQGRFGAASGEREREKGAWRGGEGEGGRRVETVLALPKMTKTPHRR
ncbi:MAG: hypothetical protein BJ554DRAFT_1077 [Olpidium bornovanus]|uniref:Uncharacterized protein n=1 Tax=Olpidium bornovanus TaxID=278681 RepID=A0A8H7ZSZ0_9FUNG|nr:MAG: hypothetical protein BJ554DRAFT_1077 [Olpidium bornovanus]